MTRRLLMTVDAVGGVWTYALDLASALRPLGWETVLAVLGPATSPAQRAAATAAGVTLVDTGLPLDWLAADVAAVADAATRVAALAATHAVDLVHLNQPALAGAATFPVPVIVATHSCVATWWDAVRGGPAPAGFAWQTELVERGLRAADAVVAPSHAFAAMIAAQYGVRPAVVHNGRTPFAAPATPMHDFAFTAGRLWDAGKDIATLDRAAARLAVPFKAAGPLTGPHGETVAVTNLHALGAVDAGGIAACLAPRPVFASAARYEPFGLAVLEAALAGCALVLADIPTFRELWDGTATFVAPGDDASFAAAIGGLIGDTARRVAQGEAACAHAARYTVAAMAAGMDRIYARRLDDAGSRRIAAAPGRRAPIGRTAQVAA